MEYKKALLFDSDEDLVEIYQDVIETKYFNLHYCKCKNEVISLIDQIQFDLIFLDNNYQSPIEEKLWLDEIRKHYSNVIYIINGRLTRQNNYRLWNVQGVIDKPEHIDGINQILNDRLLASL